MKLKHHAKRIQAHGTGGDTVLAHINPDEARMLARTQGMSKNAKTGLPEFGLFKKLKGAAIGGAMGYLTGGPAGAAAGAAGSLLGGSGSKKTGSGSSTQGLPSWLLPYVQKGVGDASKLYDSGRSTVAPLSSVTTNAINTLGSADTISPYDKIQEYLSGQMTGGKTNPYLDKMFNQASRAVGANYDSQYEGSGRTESGAAQRARIGGMDDLATQIYGGQYNADRQYGLQAAGLADANANSRINALGAQANAGGILDAHAQQEQDDPWTRLQRYMQGIQGNYGGSANYSTSKPQNGTLNSLAGAAGGIDLARRFGLLGGDDNSPTWLNRNPAQVSVGEPNIDFSSAPDLADLFKSSADNGGSGVFFR